jgi:antitoxin (DNA-binding transcriptional repressor) of toxin-antitoxin stability system
VKSTTSMLRTPWTLCSSAWKRGEEIVITRHGKAVARLVPNVRRGDHDRTRAAFERIRERAGRLQARQPVAFRWADLKAMRDQCRPSTSTRLKLLGTCS